MAKATNSLKPVYEAHFTDGTMLRMSFWSAKGKPLDIERGRRVIALAIKPLPTVVRLCPVRMSEQPDPYKVTMLEPVEVVTGRAYRRKPTANEGKTVARGFVELDGQRWADTGQDSIPIPGARAARKPAAGKVLAELLAYLDGEHGDARIIERARELVAA